MEFEDILKEVGSYGPFQRNLVFLFLAPFCILGPFFHMALIFVVTVPDHWCKVPELAASNLSLNEKRALIQAPEDPQCLMNNLNYSKFFTNEYVDLLNDTEAVRCQHGWEYDKSEFDATAATKWNMVCGDAHYVSLILTLQNIGGLIATPIYGLVADRLGRKTALFIAIGVTSLSELLSILTSTFPLFALLKCVSGAAMPTIMILPYILVSEIVGPDKRVLISGIVNTCWTAGMCALSLVMHLSRSWITMGVINTLASLLTIILYWKYVPESPAWLLSVEKYEEAYNTLMRIGIKNEKIPDELSLVKKLQYLGEKISAKKEEEKQKNFYQFVIKYPNLRKIFLIVTFCWVTTLTGYNGLQYNVIGLEGSVFLNFFLLSVVEIPGNLLFWALMERMGRRWTAFAGYLMSAIICILPVTGLPYCEVISSALGKLIISGVFMVTDQQACELFPTVCRSFGIGASKTIVKGATLLVPYLIYLAKYGRSIPFVTISVLCSVAGILTSFLPESLNENLPQNISDTEQLGRDQKFFSFNRKKRASKDFTPTLEPEMEAEGEPAVFAIKTPT